jgi:hypothetical protein
VFLWVGLTIIGSAGGPGGGAIGATGGFVLALLIVFFSLVVAAESALAGAIGGVLGE